MVIINHEETEKLCKVINQAELARLCQVSTAIVNHAIRGGYKHMDSPKIGVVIDWLRAHNLLVEEVMEKAA